MVDLNVRRLHLFMKLYKYLHIFAHMPSKNVTLKVKKDIYARYREHCRKKGLIVSRQFEIMMEEHLGGED